MPSRTSRTSLKSLTLLSLLLPLVSAVKFSLQASHNPTPKCLWNYAMSDTLVVISVSAPMAGNLQRLDMEVVDGSSSRNTYQSKRGLKGETRMAITTHADADLGVCFKNVLDPCQSRISSSSLSNSFFDFFDFSQKNVDQTFSCSSFLRSSKQLSTRIKLTSTRDW